jgi:glycosyltransferase involved in cell wall biosynthesis
MKKLMIVIHSLSGGGAERVLINLLKGLDNGEFSTTLVLYENIFDYPLPEGIELEILNIGASRNVFRLTAGFLLKIKALAGLMRRRRPDVIFSLLSSTNVTVLLAKLASLTRCRTVISEHTYPSVNLANETYGRVTKMFMKALYPKADKTVAVSAGIKDDLVRNFGVKEEAVTVIPNPVDILEIERLSTEEAEHPWFVKGEPVVISIGRLTKQKGYPYLVKAFSMARKSRRCRLLIVGEGEDREELVRMRKEMELEDEIDFLGFQVNPFKYMARSSLFVMASLYEGFPNVLLEALALGLPVISTDCPSGPAEIIENGKNGLLVPVGEPEAMARAIVTVLADEELRRSLAGEARARARCFGLEAAVEAYRMIFLEGSPSPP